jgi:hypothetical protein
MGSVPRINCLLAIVPLFIYNINDNKSKVKNLKYKLILIDMIN